MYVNAQPVLKCVHKCCPRRLSESEAAELEAADAAAMAAATAVGPEALAAQTRKAALAAKLAADAVAGLNLDEMGKQCSDEVYAGREHAIMSGTTAACSGITLFTVKQHMSGQQHGLRVP